MNTTQWIQRIGLTLIVFFAITPIITSAQGEPVTPWEFSEYFATQANREILSENKHRADLLRFFCTTTKDQTIASEQVLYNANESLFLQLLCQHVSNSRKAIVDTDDSYIALKTWAEIGVYDSWYDPDFAQRCSTSRMQECELETVATTIIQSLFNEYFTFGQAYVYGRPQPEEENIDETVKNFIKQILHWLDVGDSASDYPETKKTVKSSIQKANNMIKRDIQILDVDKILEKFDDEISCEPKTKWDIVICGLIWDKLSPWQSFADLLYNEYFFYRLWIHFYAQQIQTNRGIFTDDIRANSLKDQQIERIGNIQQHAHHTDKALTTATKYLREMYATYPIHIGMITYYEKLYSLRGQLIALVTPLYTLSDKLQNVQDSQ